MEKIRVGITGYGNLGKGVEYALENADDMELAGIFSRRSPEQINPRTSVPVYSMQQAEQMKDDIDVMIVCGGSANDLPVQTAQLAAHFNLVDSFDTHAKIPEHFSNVNEISKNSGKISIISAGWDPGMFSLNRLYSQAILPNGSDYTFWGPGVSQGHSDAVRRIEGVLNAKQYTIPSEEALNRVRSGEQPQLTVREKHTRECFVVAEKGADLDRIENEIKSMPNYFADYDTTVHFISKDEFEAEHMGIPHGGVVLRTGATGENQKHKQIIEYKLTLDSNPEFTAGVLVACARAAYRMNKEGLCGCKTLFDIAPSYLHPQSADELRKNLL
ncbi:MAG: diaminopimelate dehydrogenase [Eubacterium sp.]|nr:diaminopimelate dehydrogenase [Eubacterium sp.]